MGKRVAAVVVVVGVVALAAWLWRGAKARVEGRDGAAGSTAVAPPAEAAAGLARNERSRPGRAAGKESEEEAAAEADAEDDEVRFLRKDPRWRSLEVTTVDATSGAPVAGRWNHGEAPRRKRGEASSLESGEEAQDAIWAEEADLDLDVRPPVGYVVLDESRHVAAALAADCRSLRAVVPLHREAVLHVRVLGPDGRPAEGAELVGLLVAGRSLRHEVEDVGPGELRVRGIPHLPGEPVRGGLSWGGFIADDDVPVAEDDDASPELTTSVPADSAEDWSVVVRLTGPVGHLGDHVETDNDHPPRPAPAPVAKPGAPRGRVRVMGLGWDGRPARDASVLSRSLDHRGEATLEDLPVEEIFLRMTAPGRFPATASVRVKADATTDVVLQEPEGARLDVVVVDEEGRPRPFARVRVDRLSFDLADGTQRIDPFTDAYGRRSIARVDSGEATVFAHWGTRHGRATVTLRDGERSTVRIVAR